MEHVMSRHDDLENGMVSAGEPREWFDDEPRTVRVWCVSGIGDNSHLYTGSARFEYDHESRRWFIVDWSNVEYDEEPVSFDDLPGDVQAEMEREAWRKI